MAGKWWAFVPTTVGQRDKPQVSEMRAAQPRGYATRIGALTALRKTIESEDHAAREKVAELGRALAHLREMEEES